MVVWPAARRSLPPDLIVLTSSHHFLWEVTAWWTTVLRESSEGGQRRPFHGLLTGVHTHKHTFILAHDRKKLLFIPVTTVCLLRKEMNHRHTVCWILFSLILILSGFFGLTPMVIYCPSGCSQLQLTQLVKRTLFIPWWSRLAVMWCACFEYSECRLSRRFISWLSFFVGIVLDVVSRYHKCVYYSRNFFIFLPFPPQEDFHLFGGRSGGAMFSVCHQYCESWVAWVQLSPRARCSLYVTSALSWYSLSCGSM